MKKYIWIVLALIIVDGCGNKDNKAKPTSIVTTTLETESKGEETSTVDKTTSISSVEVNMVAKEQTIEDFVPEHVRKSSIEVVPH